VIEDWIDDAESRTTKGGAQSKKASIQNRPAIVARDAGKYVANLVGKLSFPLA